MNHAPAATATTAANAPITIAGVREVFAGVLAAGATAAGRSSAVPGLIIVAAAGATIVASTPGVSAGATGEATAGVAARSASANSCAVWKRSSERLASALRTTASSAGGNCTLSVEGANGSSLSTFCIVVVAVAPANGRSPVKNW